MTTEVLIVRSRPGETRLARLDAQSCIKDFAVYRPHQHDQHGQVGAIYLGRVKKVLPALEAAFVDLGTHRDGFLGLSEARPQPHMGGQKATDRISDHVHEGQVILVQVLAEARDDKGPKITRRISLAGAHCILTPNDPGVRLSKRIKNDGERNRLRASVLGKLNDDTGCVVRSGAIGISETRIQHELNLLQTLWTGLERRANDTKPPACLSGHAPPPIQFLSESGFFGLAKIIIDDPAMATAVETDLNTLDIHPKILVERHPGGGNVFVDMGIADEISELLNPTVSLHAGGSLIIEETAALTSIDVNVARAATNRNSSGKNLALTTNLEAVRETARQMRLRNLAGLIVIDLLPMRGKDVTGRVVNTLKDALAFDPMGPHVLGTTTGGLLEITRPRRRPPLSHIWLKPCSRCITGFKKSALTVGLEALDRVLSEVWAVPALLPALRVHPDVLTALNAHAQPALDEIEGKLGQPLPLIGDDQLPPEQFHVEPASFKGPCP